MVRRIDGVDSGMKLGLSPRHELQVCITHLTKASLQSLDMAGNVAATNVIEALSASFLLMWLQRRLNSAPQRYSCNGVALLSNAFTAGEYGL